MSSRGKRTGAMCVVAAIAIAPVMSAQELFTTLGSPPDPCAGDFGRSLDGGADFDADGCPDLLVGVVPCSVRVISGRTNATLLKIDRPNPTQVFGHSVRFAGDLNGDGVPEILVGAPSSTAGAIGTCFVFDGSDGSQLFAWTHQAGYGFGRAIDAIGDFNGDGVSDIALGNPDDAAGWNTGLVEVRSGSNGQALLSMLGGGLFGYSVSPQIGRWVTRVGDIDGNGTDEFAASGELGWIVRGSLSLDVLESHSWRPITGGADLTGDGVPDLATSYYYSVPSNAVVSIVDLSSGNPQTYASTGVGSAAAVFPSNVGGTLSIAGDFYGIGRSALIIGAGAWNTGHPSLLPTGFGKAWVVSAPAPATANYVELNGNPQSGGSVAMLGDINGNGRPELAVGAPGYIAVFSSCGTVSTYGSVTNPCPGIGGIVPELTGHGCASPGGIVYFDLEKLPGGSVAIFFFGLQQANQPLGFGCALKVAPLLAATLGPLPVLPIGATGPGIGFLSLAGKLPLPLPPMTITMQAFVPDPNTVAGFAATNGLQFEID